MKVAADEAEAEIRMGGGQPFPGQGRGHRNDPSVLDRPLRSRDDRGPAPGRRIAPIRNPRRANTDSVSTASAVHATATALRSFPALFCMTFQQFFRFPF